MLVLALSLTAFHVKSKTRSSSSLPLSLFVKNSFFISHAFVVWVQSKSEYLNGEPRKREAT